MILLRFLVTTFVTSNSFLKSYVLSGRTNLFRAREARLHTATSSGLVYSTISVHRLLHLMVPRFCEGDKLIKIRAAYSYTMTQLRLSITHLLVAFFVAGVFVKHVGCPSLRLRLENGEPKLLSFYAFSGPALLLVAFVEPVKLLPPDVG